MGRIAEAVLATASLWCRDGPESLHLILPSYRDRPDGLCRRLGWSHVPIRMRGWGSLATRGCCPQWGLRSRCPSRAFLKTFVKAILETLGSCCGKHRALRHPTELTFGAFRYRDRVDAARSFGTRAGGMFRRCRCTRIAGARRERHESRRSARQPMG